MDADCMDGLACFHRGDQLFDEVPGCSGGPAIRSFDFCYRHVPTYGALDLVTQTPGLGTLGVCQGDCGTFVHLMFGGGGAGILMEDL